MEAKRNCGSIVVKMASLLILAALIGSGCTLDPFSSRDNDRLVTISVSAQPGTEFAASTVLPSDPTGDVAEYLLRGRNGNADYADLATFAAVGGQLASSATVALDAGTWDFTLQAKDSAGSVLVEGTLTDVAIGGDATSLAFTLTPVATDNGSVSVTVQLPDGHVIASVVPTWNGTAQSALTPSGNTATFTKNDVSSGSYILTFTLKDADDTAIVVVSELVRVIPNLTSSKTITLTRADVDGLNVNSNGEIQLASGDPIPFPNASGGTVLGTFTGTGFDFQDTDTDDDIKVLNPDTTDGIYQIDVNGDDTTDFYVFWTDAGVPVFASTSTAGTSNVTVTPDGTTSTITTVTVDGTDITVDIAHSDPYTEGLQFTLNDSEDGYTVAKGTLSTGDIVIPGVYRGLPVTEIGDFSSTTFSSISIPTSVTHIGENAFQAATVPADFTLPPNLESIGDDVFKNANTGFSEITIPASVTTMGSTFNGNATIDVIRFDGETPPTSMDSNLFGSILIRRAFVPESAVHVQAYNDAFADQSVADFQTSVTTHMTAMPESDPWTPGLEFTLINSDTEYEVGSGSLFQYENSRDRVLEIPDEYLGKPVTRVANYAFSDEDYWNANPDTPPYTEIDFGANITEIGTEAFMYSDLTTLSLPEGITTIGTAAFARSGSLETLTLPSGLTSIGEQAIFKNSELTSVTFPDTLTSIGDYAFQHCDALTSVDLPQSLETIGAGAFAGWYDTNSSTAGGLTSVTIPSGVTFIGRVAFAKDSSGWDDAVVDTVTVLAAAPPTMELGRPQVEGEWGAFGPASLFDAGDIIIPTGTTAAYETANVWSLYAGKFVERGNLFSDDFSTDGDLDGSTPDFGGAWSVDSGSVEISFQVVDTSETGSGTVMEASADFGRSLGAGETLTLKFVTTDLYTGDFVNGSTAGISLYDTSNEQFFIGNVEIDSAWGIDGDAVTKESLSPSNPDMGQAVEFTYAYDTGAWTLSIGDSGTNGTTTAELALNQIGILADTGNGGNIAVDSIDVSAAPTNP